MPCCLPQCFQQGVLFILGLGAGGRQMLWLREGESACLVACEQRPTNSFSVVSQPHPLRRQGENPLLEACFPALSIQDQERYLYLGLQVGLETSLSGCFIACLQINSSRAPHKTLRNSKPEVLLCCLCPALSFCCTSPSSAPRDGDGAVPPKFSCRRCF